MDRTQIAFVLLTVSAGLLGVAAKEKFKFGQDNDWPPYAFKNANGGLEGIGKDIIDGMNALCDDIEIEVVYTKWADCWTDDDNLGPKIVNGTLDACMTYTHARGSRDTKAGWSGAFLKIDKSAGLITKLDKDGLPMVKGDDDLNGKTVADVGGWAPTSDTIEFVTNKCTNAKFSSGKTMKVITAESVVNDKALKEILDGNSHALYVYGDTAKTFLCKNDGTDASKAHNCTLWSSNWGKPHGFAYFQTGMFGWTINGTTLAMTKPDSTVGQKINPCLNKFMQTKEFFDVCKKHGQECSCVPNSHFASVSCASQAYNKPTSEQSGTCSNGYCPCPTSAGSTTGTQATTGTDVTGHVAHHHTVSALALLALLLTSTMNHM